MTPREIRENLGRVKAYYLRNESQRALASAIAALQGMGNTPLPTDMRAALREAVQLLARDAEVTKFCPQPLMYQPGQEKKILSLLVTAYKAIRLAASIEDHDAALARKIKLDQAYNQGLRHLEQKRVSEADASFTEALTHYHDEHRIFAMIGKALMEAGEVRRAYPYLKRGAEVDSQSEDMRLLFEECSRRRAELKGGENPVPGETAQS